MKKPTFAYLVIILFLTSISTPSLLCNKPSQSAKPTQGSTFSVDVNIPSFDEKTIQSSIQSTLISSVGFVASSFALVAVEDLKLKNMTKSAKGTVENPGKNVSQKRGMNRSMIRLGLGTLLLRIEQKCVKFGSQFIRVNPRYTSQICSSCGHRDKKSRESQTRYKCIKCNHELNADVNAAFNILDRALA